MMSHLSAMAAILSIAAPSAVPQSPPSSASRLLPANDQCRLNLGNFSSSLGPVRLALSMNTHGSNLYLTRDGIPGHAEAAGIARVSGTQAGAFNFSHRLAANSYNLDVGSQEHDLVELVATSHVLTISPLSSNPRQSLGVDDLFKDTAPHFTVALGDLASPVAELAQCAEDLTLADKANFCVHITVFQANQGCPVSSWKLAAGDDHQMDWIDTNRIKRDGTAVQFETFTQHGRAVAIKQPADRRTAIRVVVGDCASHVYSSKMFATFDDANKEISMALDEPRSDQDQLVDQDLAIVCTGHWRSSSVAQPDEETRERFDQQRVRVDERSMFKRY